MGNKVHRPLTITTTSSPRVAAAATNTNNYYYSSDDDNYNNNNTNNNNDRNYDSDSGYYYSIRRTKKKKKKKKPAQIVPSNDDDGGVAGCGVGTTKASVLTLATTISPRHVFLKNYYHSDKDVEVFAKQLRCTTNSTKKNPITQFHMTHYPNGVLSRKGYVTLFDAMERNDTIQLLGLELLSNDMDIPRMMCNLLRHNRLQSCTKLELLLSNTKQIEVCIEFIYALIKNTTIVDLKFVCNGTSTSSSSTTTTTSASSTTSTSTSTSTTPPTTLFVRKDSDDSGSGRSRQQQLGETFQKLLEQNTIIQNIYFHNLYRTDSMGDDFVEYFAEGLKYNRSVKSVRFTVPTTKGILAIANALRYNTTVEKLFLQSTDFETISLIALFEALEDNETLTSLTLHAGYRLYKLDENIVYQSIMHSLFYNDTLQNFKFNRYAEGTRNNLFRPVHDIIQQNRPPNTTTTTTTTTVPPRRIAPLKQYRKRITIYNWLSSNNMTEW